MKKLVATSLLMLAFAWMTPADAQLFGRKPKSPPTQRVAELIGQAKADPSESKRAAAAEELRDFDAKTFPEIVPVLIDVARSDKSAAVRHEALDSLARIRPVSQGAGQTLEWAAAHDDSWRNRWQAKTALTRYQWAGYHASKNDAKNPQTPTTKEPPLFDPARPAVKAGTTGRTAPAKTTAPQSSLPKIVTVPTPPKATEPARKTAVTPTPPPIIVDTPPRSDTAPAAKATVPPVPMLDLGPTVGAPNAPVVAEPNFRPAGQAPPRVPPTPTAPAKKDDRGPALTVPM